MDEQNLSVICFSRILDELLFRFSRIAQMLNLYATLAFGESLLFPAEGRRGAQSYSRMGV